MLCLSRTAQPWQKIVVTAGAALAGYFLIIRGTAAHLVAFDVYAVAAAVLTIAGAARRPTGGRGPWWLLAAGVVVKACGDLTWTFTTPIVGPLTVHDLLYVAAYPVFAAAVFLVGYQRLRPGLDATLDTLIAAGGISVVTWQFFIVPHLTGTGGGQAQAVIFPLFDLLLVGMAMLALLSGGGGHRDLRMLLYAASCQFVADTGLSVAGLAGYRPGSILDAGWLLMYALAAVAAWCPDRQRAGRDTIPTTWRAVLLGAAAIQAPGLLVLHALTNFPHVVAGVDVAAFVITALVAVRMFLLVVNLQRRSEALATALREGKQLAADLKHRSLHDALTGLPNRDLLDRHTTAHLSQAGSVQAMMFVDLDDFKTVNDSQGHGVGDALLTVVADRLAAAVRSGDVVSRLGGDEFAVLLTGVRDADHATRIADRVHTALREPITVDGFAATVRASVGVALSDEPSVRAAGDTASQYAQLVACADIAMYAAKHTGKGRTAVYEPGMQTLVLGDAALAADLAAALASASIDVAYQPLVKFSTGQPVSVEALVRWNHPTRGPVRPDEFLPVAVRHDLGVNVDLYVLRRALADLAAWRRTQPHAASMCMSVNASAQLLARDDLVDLVMRALDDAGLPGEVLVLELTEQACVDDIETLSKRLQQLRDHGVQIALDDFGTGYSALSYLARLPVDALKLDRSFIRDGVTDAGVQPLLRAAAGIGPALGLRVVAEGIETPSQHAALAALGCTLGQGYLYSKPLPAAELVTWWAAHQPAATVAHAA